MLKLKGNSNITHKERLDWLSLPEDARKGIVEKFQLAEEVSDQVKGHKPIRDWAKDGIIPVKGRIQDYIRQGKTAINEALGLELSSSALGLGIKAQEDFYIIHPDEIKESISEYRNKEANGVSTKALLKMFSVEEESDLQGAIEAYEKKFDNLMNAAQQEARKNIDATKPRHTIIGDLIRPVSYTLAENIDKLGEKTGR